MSTLEDTSSAEGKTIRAQSVMNGMVSVPYDVGAGVDLDQIAPTKEEINKFVQPDKIPGRLYRKAALAISLVIAGFVIVIGIAAFVAHNKQGNPSGITAGPGQSYSVQTVPLTTLGSQLKTTQPQSNTLTVNGSLQVNGSLVIEPASQPTNAVAGQLYYDSGLKQLAYYNGSGFVDLQTAPKSTGSTTTPTTIGVLSLNGLAGALTIAGTTTNGGTITPNDASTTQKGIAQFNANNFTSSGGVVNTVQNIGIGAAPIFAQLTLSSGNLNGQTISSAANFTGSVTINGVSNFNAGATVTGTLTADTITPDGPMTLGATSQSLLLQGNGSTTISSTTGGNTTTLGFDTPTANVTYNLPTASAGTYDICTTIGNCGGGGGSLTGAGTTNTIAMFTGSEVVGNSILTQSSTTITVAGTLSATNLQGNGSAVTNVNAVSLQGNTTSYFTNASNISSGTLADARLSGNVPLLNANDNFTGTNLEHNGSEVCDISDNCSYLTGSAANGAYIELQASTPGTAQTGNYNISGTGVAGSLKATTIFQNGNKVCDVSGNCTVGGGGSGITGSGTANTLAMFTSTGAIGNSLITQSVSTETVAGTLSATSLQGNGSSITSLNASNLSSGTVADARLSGNVPMLNATTNNFTGTNLEHNGSAVCDASDNCGYLTGSAANGAYLELQASTPGTAQTGNYNISGTGISGTLKATSVFQNGNQVCDTSGNCTVGGGGSGITGSGTANTIAMFTSTGAIGNSIITQSGTTDTVGGTLSATNLQGNGSGITSLAAGNISSGTLADARLSGNVPLLNAATDNFTGTNLQHNGNAVCDASGNCSGVYGGGVTTVGAYSSANHYANGAQISGTTITLGSANATNPGLIDTSAQTFAGAKTFSSLLTGSAGASVTGGALTLTGNAASSLTTTAGALTLTSAIASTWGTNAGNLTLSAGSGTINLATNDTLALQGANAYITNSQGFSDAESYGFQALVTAVGGTALGDFSAADHLDTAVGDNAQAASTSGGGVAVGTNANAGWAATAIGYNATSNSANGFGTAIGSGSTANDSAVALGANSTALNKSIAIGANAVTTASNQLVIGGSFSNGDYIQNAYIGSGVTDATPQNITLHATGGSGTDIAGANFNIAGGQGTGAGNGGTINFQIAKPGTTGTSLNALATVASLSGTNGSALFKNAVNSTTAFQIQNAGGNTVLTVDTSSNGAQGLVALGKASTNNGSLVFYNSTNANTAAIQAGATSSSFSLTLPTIGAASGQCLQSGSGSTTTATNLTFGSCSGSGGTTTLQQAYNNSAGASPSIDMTSTNGGFTVQNDNTAPITGELFGVHDKTASGLGQGLFTVSNTGATAVQSSTATGNALSVAANSLTTGAGLNLTSSSQNLSTGNLLNVKSTATLTNASGSFGGNLVNVDRSLTANDASLSPTLDTSATGFTHVAGSLTMSFTVSNSFSNEYMIVTVNEENSTGICTQPSGVTYNGTSMTEIGTVIAGSSYACLYFFGLAAPTTGTHNIVVAGGTNYYIAATASDWYNINQANPVSNFLSNYTASGSSTSLTGSSVGNEVMVDSFAVNTSSSGLTPTTTQSGQTAITTFDAAPTVDTATGQSWEPAGASTTTMGWTGFAANSHIGQGMIGLNGIVESVTNSVASISNECAITAGSCNDSSSVLSLTQNYNQASGSVLNIQNNGSGFALQAQDGSGNVALTVATNGITAIDSTTSGTPAVLTLGMASGGDSIAAEGAVASSLGDYAEYFPQASPGKLHPGDVACLNASSQVEPCSTNNADDSLAGVVSTSPGFVGNNKIHNASDPAATALVSMLGQVPVKVSAANGTIHVGDMLTYSSAAGVAVKATTPGMTIGSALTSYSGSGTGEVNVYIHVGYYDPSAANLQPANYLQQGDAASFSALTVNGDATITNLSVTGNLTTATLTISHIISGGSTPAISANTALCGDITTSIKGTDTAGLITFTAPAGCNPNGKLATVTFSKGFTQAPNISLTPANADTASLRSYVDSASTSTSSFDIAAVAGSPDNSTTIYHWYYQVIQ